MENFETRPSCEICGHTTPKELYSEPFNAGKTYTFIGTYYKGRVTPEAVSQGTYHLLQCPACNFVWQREVLDDAGMNKLYEEWICTQESLEKDRTRSYDFRTAILHQVALIPFIFKRSPYDIRVLDFGMGWGSWCRAASSLGLKADGAELSQHRITHARGHGVSVQSDLFNTQEKYDFINTEQVFEHVKMPAELLKQLTAHLKENGVMRIAVPNGSRLFKARKKGIWKPRKDSVHPLEHISSFTHQNLVLLAEQAGLKPVPLLKLLCWNVKSLLWGSSSIKHSFNCVMRHTRSTGIWFQKTSA